MRRRFQGASRNGFRNQFGSVASYNVASKPFSILRIIDDFNESFRIAKRGGLARRGERKLPDLDIEACLPGLFLGVAYRRNLRLTIRAARDVVIIHRMDRFPRDVFYAENPFVTGLVGQPGTARNIADGIHAGDVRTVVLVHNNAPRLGFDAQFFQSNIFDIAPNAHRGKHLIAWNRLCSLTGFDIYGEGLSTGIDRLHLRGHQAPDTLFAERPLERLGNFDIFHRDETVE